MMQWLAFPVLLMLFFAASLPAWSQLPAEVTAERNPGKRSEIAIDAADRSLDQARAHYKAGQDQQGEEQLDLISQLADECLTSTEQAHKSKYWKKSELRIAALNRRVRSFAEELSYNQRDKANKLAAHLDSVHDKLLAGVMKK
jgi:hypothetical protein